jgi:predicted dehydrogenase
VAIVRDPKSVPGLRWGIIGAGFIAGKFVNAVTKHTRATVVAVGSRSRDKADAFAAANDVPIAHDGYEALVADPTVDAVYVATPHSHHLEHALLAIAAGKPVLIEKPLARNAAEAREIAAAARAHGVFAMEAMWTRFLPHMEVMRDILATGRIGEVIHVHAEHGQRFPFDAAHRLYDPALAGGALLDLGVYPLALVHNIFGAPKSVSALGVLTETGVDGQATLALDYGGRRQASVSTTLWALSGISATIVGTDGRVEFEGPFLRPAELRVVHPDGTEDRFDGRVPNGFQYEIAEVAACVERGALESDTLPLADSIAVLETIDAARRQIGVWYPGEEPADTGTPPLASAPLSRDHEIASGGDVATE